MCRFTVSKSHGDDIHMPNKDTDTVKFGSSSILPKHGHDCDVSEITEGEDEAWLNSVTNDEWEMSVKFL